MRLNRVVFPAPLGPISARRSPGCTSRPTPSTARRPPKCLATPSSLSASMTCYSHPSPPQGGEGRVRGRAALAFKKSPPALSPEGRGSGALAVLAWGIVARVEGQLEVLVGIVF